MKQNDRCVECSGPAWLSIIAAIVVKVAMLILLNAKVLDKAIKRSYTSTTAFATIVFTLQTATLVVSDSYGSVLQTESPIVASMLAQVQSILNPDKQVETRPRI